MKQILSKLLILILSLALMTFGPVSFAVDTDTDTVQESVADDKDDDNKDDDAKDDDTKDDDGKDDDAKDDDDKDDDAKDDDGKDDDAKDDDDKDDDTKDDDDKDDDTKDDDDKDDDAKDDDGKDDDAKDDDDKDDDAKASAITYKGKVDEAIELDADDFVSEYKSATGKTFSRLTFTSLPSSSAGVLYYDYDGKEEAKLPKNKALTKALLADISFVAKKGGTVSVPYRMTGTASSDPEVTGTVEFIVEDSGDADAISYSGKSGSVIDFSVSDFKSVCKEETGKALDYVKFTLPASSSGTLFYDYDGKEEAKVSKSGKYYVSDDPDLSLVSFVSKSGYSGTLNISYTGYNTSGKSYTGTIKVKVTSSSSSKSSDDDSADTISYSATSDKVTFKAKDFTEVCEDLTDEDLVKIVFTSLPSSSSGTLYLGYKSSSKYEDKVSKSEDYYPDDDPAISDISFVPKDGYSGTVTISYNGYYTKTKYYTGKISIRVKSSTKDDDDDDDDDNTLATISETLSSGDTADINASSLANAFKKASGKALSYVKFTLPSSSSGVLYYDYDGDDQAKVKTSDKYYASKAPYIKHVMFVPAKNFTGSVTLTYSAYAASGSAYTGKIKLTYKSSAKTDNEKASGKKDKTTSDTTLSYTVKNTPLALSVADFNAAAIRATDAAVEWIKLGLVNDRAGTLYYKYGKDGQKTLSAGAVVYGDRAPLISDVSFVPTPGYKGEVNISYTAESIEGDSFSGMIALKVHASKKHFRDVAEASWYADIVDTVCDADLMKGTGEDTFSPEASMTVAEALTMGARLHNQIKGGTDSDFVAGGDAWYDVYVAYAIQNGIIREGDFDDYTREATRAEMAYIFYHSVTPDYLAKINSRTVPDVSAEDLFGQEIYGLYDAGILTGNDEAGTFRAASHITRAEAATILGRTGNIVSRVKK